MSVSGIGPVRLEPAAASPAPAGAGTGGSTAARAGTQPGTEAPAAVAVDPFPDHDQFGRQELDRAVDKLNRTVEIFSKRFHFEIHEETKRVMVEVIDNETGEVLTEIPPEKVLDLVAQIQETVGLLVDQRI
jgi:uncharacterized FlaG/YvyC family protein